MDGFLVLDKPGGITSQQALSRVKRAFKIKKLGHTGTLDPLATGVLPVALGEATKIIPYLDESAKSYRVTGRLGESTDSYDSDGEVLRRAEAGWVDRPTLEATIRKFLGSQEQMPPVYSAIKVQGRPLYDYARSGEGVELRPRQVHFSTLELERFESPHFTLRVDCSKGTYIRSLVHDIGENLGCGAHVTELRRLASGPFELDRAISLDRLIEDPSSAASHLWSIEGVLEGWPRIEIENSELARVRSGVALHRIQAMVAGGEAGRRMALTLGSTIQALVETKAEGFDYLRVFNRGPNG